MAVDAVLEIVQAAADSSHQTISHSLVRVLSKLAAHAEGGAPQVRPQADAALRDQVRRLLGGWTLADPSPDAYGAALRRLGRGARRPPRPARPARQDGARDRCDRGPATGGRAVVRDPEHARAAGGAVAAAGGVFGGGLPGAPGRPRALASREGAGQAS